MCSVAHFGICGRLQIQVRSSVDAAHQHGSHDGPRQGFARKSTLAGVLEEADWPHAGADDSHQLCSGVEALANDKVDIAFLGGFTYVQASARSRVRPLVQRSIDQQFQSVFITPATSKIHSLADLHGHFIFGDVNSTSGHLMPLYYMQQAKVDPAVIENASYSGGHDATALAIANGKAEAGAMDELVYKKMVANGQLKPGAVRVFYITPPFFDYVWVANKDLDPKIASAFADSMKALSPTKPDQQALLDLLNAKSYVAANDADYGKLRDAAKSAGLLH